MQYYNICPGPKGIPSTSILEMSLFDNLTHVLHHCFWLLKLFVVLYNYFYCISIL